MMRRRILLGAVQIAGGSAGDQLLGLIRNIIIARIVGPENFGIGLTFALLVSFLESAVDLSWERFVVQDRQGDTRTLLSTIHLFMFARGAFLSVALFVFAGTAAAMLAVPTSVIWAYQVLALAPLLKGLMHLDVKRYQRNLRYSPDLITILSGGIVSLIVGAVLAWWLKDYHAMLYALIARYAVASAVSHFWAEQPFRFKFAPDIAARAWLFGWPLMMNGLVVFLANQGDRAIVSRWLGVETLGTFGAAAMMTLGAANIIMTTTQSLGLPLLAQHQADPAKLEESYWRFGAAVVPVALGATIGLFAVLQDILLIVFGQEFAISGLVVYWLVVALCVRLFRQWATTTLLALGATLPIMWSNAVRTLGLAMAVAALITGGGLEEVAVALVVGEATAAVAVFVYLRVRYLLGDARMLVYAGILIASNAICLAIYLYIPSSSYLLWFASHALVLLVGILLLIVLVPDVRQMIRYILPATD